MDNIKKKIGNNLKRLRLEKGFKQSELAEIVGVEDKTISRIEVGGNYPSMDLLVRLAEALNCELVDFVNFSDKVVESLNENIVLATRNLPNVILLEASEINTYDVISSDVMVVTSEAIKQIEEVLV